MPTPLQAAIARRNVDAAQWATLTNSLYPGAKPESVLLVIDYCKARNLDPLKKPCHIVPMWVKDSNGQGGMRDVVMPGIYEYRTTAQRTGEYRGHTDPVFGPDIDFQGVQVPQFCSMTMLRGPRGQEPDRFPVTVYFTEIVGLDRNGKINDRWRRSPRQMLEKCTEAAGHRKAFPDELGGEPTIEEMEGRVIEPAEIVPMPQATGTAPATAPVTSQDEQPRWPAAPTTPNTAFTRDHVRITNMEARTTRPKVNQETGEETPGQPYAVVTLTTGEQFQCFHRNLNAQLETWWKANAVLDVDCKTSGKGAQFMPLIEKAAAVQG